MQRGFVAGELFADAVVETGVVRAQVRRTVSVRDQRRTDVRVVNMRDVERAGSAAALNQRDDLLLGSNLA